MRNNSAAGKHGFAQVAQVQLAQTCADLRRGNTNGAVCPVKGASAQVVFILRRRNLRSAEKALFSRVVPRRKNHSFNLRKLNGFGPQLTRPDLRKMWRYAHPYSNYPAAITAGR
jgi:hypothetical protein